MRFWDIVTTAATQTGGAAPIPPSYQRMLPDSISVSETGSNQYAAGGPPFVSETAV